MSREDKLADFLAVTNCDPELAQVFMAMSNWNTELAVQQYLENPGRYTVGGTKPIDLEDEVRAPIEPKRQVLQDRMDGDDDSPVYEVSSSRAPRSRRSKNSFEAFRSFQDEQKYLREGLGNFFVSFVFLPNLRSFRASPSSTLNYTVPIGIYDLGNPLRHFSRKNFPLGSRISRLLFCDECFVVQ
jgi:hypothetical protein